MANRIKQFRYYADGLNEGVTPNEKNHPSQITKEDGKLTAVNAVDYQSGVVFGNCFPILQLGIQALPGTKFYLNKALEPIIIGSTGIYELDLNGQTEITSISFEESSMNLIKQNNNAYLIVDIIYDDGKE